MKADQKLVYNIDGLVAETKKNLSFSVIKICVSTLLLVLSTLAVIFFGSNILVFIGGIVLACISAFICFKLVKQISFADYSSTCGEIAGVHKDIKTVDTKFVGGVGLGQRKYDSYKKREVRLNVFIKNDKQVHGYFFNDGTEEHAKYYEAKGAAIHIWGTHFPVRLETYNGKWLCPICGEFNASDEKSCRKCKKKIIK